MEVDLLDFVEQCRHLVKQALGKHAGERASGGFARRKHVVLQCVRLRDGNNYRETPNRLQYMTEIRDVLGLDRDDLPDYSTIYREARRVPRGCTEIGDFRDDETLRVSNHLTPRVKPTRIFN